MENITSLNSPHIERVKALIGSRGKKNRELENAFIAEGIQAVREALVPKLGEGLAVKRVYVTENGLTKLSETISKDILAKYELIQVSDQVMSAMADSESPQGIIALCSTKSLKLKDLWQRKPSKIAFFWQIQDPGNAGTVIRTADACGFDVDINIEDFITEAKENKFAIYALTGEAEQQFSAEFIDKSKKAPSVWIFGNEARGLPSLTSDPIKVSIPMKGYAESLNVASAAAIVLHSIGLSL